MRLNQLNWWWGAIEIALCLRDGTRSVQQEQEATRAKRYSTYLSTSKMEGTKNGGNRIQFPYLLLDYSEKMSWVR